MRGSRTEHPGSTGGWTATQTEYDVLGRVYRTSVPTEVSVSSPYDPSTWTAAGDDYSRGWVWNKAYYDWKGRTVRTVPSDSTGSDGKDTLISYAGCGCAGGQVTTVEGPSVPRTDTSGDARRKQKVYEDILGRNEKTEAFEWDGSTVYTTLINTFNGRDQVTNSRLYSGTTSSTDYQDTTATYDGHGRLHTKHLPQQDTATATTYNYNADDTIASVTDAREKTTAYAYNSRKLVTQISYISGMSEDVDAEFEYDNVGNRTEMDDSYGTTSYMYDSLSRMTSETRQFNDDLPDAPQANDSFTISYTYTLGGQLKSLTEPTGVTVNYTQDKVGRLASVAPSTSFGGVSIFASNGQYRAWGALKHLEYSNGVEMDQTFDNGLRASTYDLATSTVNVMDKSYEYNKDGSLKFVEDNLNWKFDRSYTYDHQTRLKDGKSSTEASGTEITNGGDQIVNLPYRQSHSYDAFDNMTARDNKIWGGDANSSYSFSDNRITNYGWSYDEDGRVTATGSPEPVSLTTYDAGGRISFKHDKREPTDHEDKTYLYYDGDGKVTKKATDQCRKLIPLPPEEPAEDCEWWGGETSYTIRSTVLGGEVIADTGTYGKRYIYAGGAKFGELTHRIEWPGGPTGVSYDAVQYYHDDAAGVSQRVTRNYPEDLLGVPAYNSMYIDPRQNENDTMGTNVGLVTNYVQQPAPPSDPVIPIDGDASIFLDGQWAPVYLDGVRMSRQALRMMTIDSPSGFWLTTVYYRRTIEWDWLWVTGVTDRYIDLSEQSRDNEGWPRKLSKNEVDKIKDNVRSHLTPKCKDFIKSVINNMHATGGQLISDDIEVLMEKVGWWGYNKPGYKYGHSQKGNIYLPISNRLGSLSDGRPMDFWSLDNRQKVAALDLSFSRFATDSEGAITTIHELIHAAIKNLPGGDRVEADAALRLTGEKFFTPEGREDEADSMASSIFQDRLAEACGGQRRHPRIKDFIMKR